MSETDCDPENAGDLKRAIRLNTPILLATAAKIAFPDGSMDLAGLRREIAKGRLSYEAIAGRLYTTLADINEMRESCRVRAKNHRFEARTAVQSGSPETSGELCSLNTIKQQVEAHQKPGATNNRMHDVASIMISDILAIYYQDKGGLGNPDKNLAGHIQRLTEFWGGKTLVQVTPKTCCAYVSARPCGGGARRDLEVLRAAINNHAKQNLHYGKVSVTLPPKGEARAEWITRNQAAAVIWAAWRYREVQTIHCGENKGKQIVTTKRPLQHIARFILIGCYTGTRAGAIASASIKRATGKSYVDLDAGLFYRKAIGKRNTKKRQPIVPLPPRLLHHMRRWVRFGIVKENFIEYRGRPIQRVNKGFASAVRLAKLDIKVTPHTLRHTAATWLMQAGVQEWEAAGYLGMSVEVLRSVYGHHHPEFMKSAVEGISSKQKTRLRSQVT